MASNENGLMQVELSAELQAEAALTNSGDDKTFTFGYAPLSSIPGFEYAVFPAGLISGGVLSGTATNNQVSYTAITAVLASAAASSATTGILSKTAGNVTVTRPSTDTHKISSIYLKNDNTVVEVEGDEGTSFSTTRGAAGGPPLIPTDGIEIGQVFMSSQTAAPIAASEIKQVPGVSQERFDLPGYTVNEFTGTVTFNSALPKIHTGPTTKEVRGVGATPNFTTVVSRDYTPSTRSVSTSSTQYYGNILRNSSTQSVNSASFTVEMQDGITDGIAKADGQTRLTRYYPDRNKAPYRLEKGLLTVAPDYTTTGQTEGAVTITPLVIGYNVES